MKFEAKKLNMFFLLLILIVLFITCIYLIKSLHTDPVTQSIKNDQVLKILFIVSDETECFLTQFLVYYPVTQRAGLLEISGNVGAIYESIGRVDRLDAVYKDMGSSVYTQEVEKLLGTQVPFVIEIKLKAFCSLIDIMGGIKVFVPTNVDMTQLQTGDRFLLPSGAVLLDGDKIKDFLMYQLPDENEDALIQRREEAFLAFLQALHAKQDILFEKANFHKIYSLFTSSLQENSLRQLLMQLSSLDAEQLSPQSIMGTIRLVDGKRLVFPFYEGQLVKESVKRITSSLITGDTEHSRVYVLDIKNGTPTQGLARNTSVLLQSVGYDILNTQNADRNDYDKTFIINHIGDETAGKSLGDFLHCTQIIMEEVAGDDAGLDANANVDFTIVLGKDFDGRYVR